MTFTKSTRFVPHTLNEPAKERMNFKAEDDDLEYADFIKGRCEADYQVGGRFWND